VSNAAIVKAAPSLMDLPATPSLIDAYAEKLADVMHMEDVKTVIDKFDEQDELLKKAKEYGELRARYAALEAATYVKIVKKGWEGALGKGTAYRKQAAIWLAKSDKYDEYISEILNGEGETLVSIWSRECNRHKREKHTHDCIKWKGTILQHYDSFGYACVNDYLDTDQSSSADWHAEQYLEALQETPTRGDSGNWSTASTRRDHNGEILQSEWLMTSQMQEVQQAFNDSTRIALRRRGAVGIGNHKYIDPERYPEELEKAIIIRRRNITYCIKKLWDMCKASDKSEFQKVMAIAIDDAGLPIHLSITSNEGGE